MDIDISAKRIVVEDEVKEKARQLAERLAQEFPNQKITSVKILFSSERAWQPVEVLVNAKNLSLHAASKCTDMRASLPAAFDKIHTQIGRYLDRIRDASVKADPVTKDKIWKSTDLKEAADDADLEGYDYEFKE
ncbi:MAG: HPF/RaiA family ribosome-associated protein [Victivallales bacterium]|nr:HPF/RaiA family ribosome-associated protein [Victivallales bacterium]